VDFLINISQLKHQKKDEKKNFTRHLRQDHLEIHDAGKTGNGNPLDRGHGIRSKKRFFQGEERKSSSAGAKKRGHGRGLVVWETKKGSLQNSV